ncbi:hypothetical protein GWC95_15645 [Sediminibacterium roseum]|uniref:Type I restriction modification DNA specificity domain-containing protein n=1 Tax=Sediminibacterium roseum TaxID=1978412 RepID=A0ABW9ZW22_9BACT|nr:restriction endonuclease subunit S [Sediminibacterium roseum]NCI51362.1 hypothetical protein [Sediminibacterium roseum]
MAKKQKDIKVPNLRFPGFEGEWVKKTLGELCVMQAGKFVNASEISHITNKDYYPCYGGNGLRGYTKTFNYDGKYSLIGRQGALCGNVNPADGRFHATEHAIVVTPNKSIDSDWMFYLLTALNLNKYATGMAQPGLSVKNLERVEAIIPKTTDEQKKIGIILSLLDTRIQTQSKIIDTLKTLIKSFSNTLFLRRLRIKDENGKEFDDWKQMSGADIFASCSNTNHNSDLPILAITQDMGAVPRNLIDYQISVTDKSIESYKVVEIGDFIISLRSFQGGIEYSSYKGICSPAYVILRNKVEIDHRFYKYYFKSNSYIQLLNKKLEGIRDGKMISYKYFSEISLPYPTIKEQIKISNLLSTIDSKIKVETDLLFQLKKQKRVLLSRLFI